MMMKAAEDRLSSELAEPLNGPMARRILFQGQIRSEFVVARHKSGSVAKRVVRPDVSPECAEGGVELVSLQ
jgi:hypothetical protein